MQTMQDLTITLADKPGTLAKATEAIAKAGIQDARGRAPIAVA